MEFDKPEDGKPFLKRKKKQKRSFLQTVKKKFGGTKHNLVDHEYFMRVFELERKFDGTPEEKSVFANNALSQTDQREVECSCDQLVSRVIESLLPLASDAVLERFCEAFGANLRPVCVHEYASHVLQALMIITTKHALLKDTVVDKENNHVDHCKSWILKVCRFLINNIPEFIGEKYANPTLRTGVFCLAGVPQMDKHDRSDKESIDCTEESEEFLQLLDEYYQRVINWKQFQDLVNNPLSSGFLQSLLQALRHARIKQYRRLCKKILAECFASSTNGEAAALFSSTALPVLEVIIETSKKKQLQKIYLLISERLKAMSTARVANITIQKFVNRCNNPEMVEEIVTKLVPAFHEVLASNNEGVLVSLCNACQRLQIAQSQFFVGLTTSLNCQEAHNEQLVLAILSCTPLPFKDTPIVKKHGSLLLQSLLGFQKPSKLMKSLLSFDRKELATMLSTTYGCHVTQAFCQSGTVGAKSRTKFIQHLIGYYPFLAQSKFGSRSFDDIWEVADLNLKVQIVEDLSSGFSEVMKSEYGKFVVSKVKLEEFRTHGAEKWKANQHNVLKTKEIFLSVIGKNK